MKVISARIVNYSGNGPHSAYSVIYLEFDNVCPFFRDEIR